MSEERTWVIDTSDFVQPTTEERVKVTPISELNDMEAPSFFVNRKVSVNRQSTITHENIVTVSPSNSELSEEENDEIGQRHFSETSTHSQARSRRPRQEKLKQPASISDANHSKNESEVEFRTALFSYWIFEVGW